MPTKPELTDYINFKRREGLPDDAIRQALAGRGWTDLAIAAALAESIVLPNDSSGHPILPPDSAAQVMAAEPSPHQHRMTLAKPLLLLFVLLLLLGGIGGLSYRHRGSSAMPAAATNQHTTVRDTNYRLSLPPGWSATSDYRNGAGVNTFAPATSLTALGASRMTIYVLPQQATETASTHIVRQIHGFSQNSGQVVTLSTETVSFAGTAGEIRQVTIAPPSDPNAVIYHIFGGVVYGKTIYNIDVTVPARQWPASHVVLLESVKSFSPKNPSITTKPRG